MDARYSAWISSYVDEHGGSVQNKCSEATASMVAHFPELRRERGFLGGGLYQHWWCVAPGGEIVDPTVSQFREVPPSSDYVAYDVEIHGPEPTGKCMDCGAHVYDGKGFCSDECERATMAYLRAEEKKWKRRA